MKSPAWRRTVPTLAVSSALIVLGATALLPCVRALEALPLEAFLLASSETMPWAPALSLAMASPADRADASRAEPTEEARDAELEREEQDLRSIFDRTVIRRRVGIENELIDLEDTAWTNRTELSGIFAIGPQENFDLALGLVVPVAYFASEEPPGREDNFGLGDIELSTAAALRHAPWFAHAAAFEVKFNTATDDTLGGSATNLKPYYLASIRPLSYLGTVLEVAYNGSVSEEVGVGKTRNLELNPSVNFTYPEEWLWFLRVQYKGKVDFANDDDYTNRMEVSVGKIVGDEKNISLYVAMEFPLDDETDQYSGKVGLTYFFD